MRGPVVLADGVRILDICVHPDEDAHFDQIVKRCVCVISRQTSYSVELLIVGQDICPLHRVLYLLGNSHYPIGRLPRPPARRGSQRHAATLSRPDSLSLIPCQPLRAAGCEASRWRTSSSLCHRLLDESGFPVPDTLTPTVDMAPRDPSRWQLTPYLIYLVFVTTLGPLQFGYHLVCCPSSKCPFASQNTPLTAPPDRLNSTLPKPSSPARRRASPRS